MRLVVGIFAAFFQTPTARRLLIQGITTVILRRMKTAISIPDEIFLAAEQLAKRIGSSRSELYATALAAYLKDHQHQGVTERLNAVYAQAEELSALDPVYHAFQVLSLPREDW